jgi:DegV family protein with EDD domain
MSVTVVTDGAASLPDELAAANGVVVVPLALAIGGVPASTRLSLAEVLAWSPGQVHTSGPSTGRFLDAIREHGGDGGVLVCTVAASLSGSFQAASMAARHAARPVRVLDTATATGGQGLVVLAAACAARAGATLDEAAAAAGRAAAAVRLVGAVDSLDRLLAGGRLPRLAGRVGDGLGVWPLFELGGGRVRPLRPARSRAAAEARIVERWRASRGGDADLHVAAVHALAPERAERLLAAVRAELQPATAFVGEFDAAMASHSGPGAAALAWWWEPRA